MAKYHREILEKEKIPIFINSLSKSLSHWLQLQYPQDFKTVLENAAKIEETLINNESLKILKYGKGFSNHSLHSNNSSNYLNEKTKLDEVQDTVSHRPDKVPGANAEPPFPPSSSSRPRIRILECI